MSLDAKTETASVDVDARSMTSSTTSTPPKTPDYTPPTPTFRLLFSLVSRRDVFVLILPAMLLSIIAGGVAPFMTFVIGQVFNTFAKFSLIDAPTAHDKSTLRHGVAISAIELLGLAVAALALSSATSSLWIWTGERNTALIRRKVYTSVANKEMAWYDTKIGTEDAVQTAEGNGPVGAGGLMAKFAKDTEEIRMASSLACGMVLQHLTTCVACLVLGFTRSWALTLVILSAVPVMMAVQAVSQATAGPLVGVERARIASAATVVDRAVNAIATVKAFNAAAYEYAAFTAMTEKLRTAAWDLNRTWAFTSGMTQFTVMAMFVQGFWFGAKLVRDGSVGAGDVMAVFWACLIATTNLQMCIPHFITLAKGKFSMSSLIGLVEAPTPVPVARRGSVFSTLPRRKTANFRKIVPKQVHGDISLHNVTFAYPSRPAIPVLNDVTLFLAAGETTFIVGGSGSGKSTIAQLLLRMYDIQEGDIMLDEQDVEYLDLEWTRQQIGAVSQGAILFDMSVHDNVAMGLAGSGSGRRPEGVTRQEVIGACTVALMQRFVEDLPNGYDTMLGNGGANLSGGQKQRLAIARAMLRDPKILILDEATSALDATSRILVFEAIKRCRQNKTTVVITHDLSQISPDDFVYVLKDGYVAEQGFRHDLEGTVGGEFRKMAETQSSAGGFTEKELDLWSDDAVRQREERVERIFEEQERAREEQVDVRRQSIVQPSLRPLTLSNWMFDVVHDLTRNSGVPTMPQAVLSSRESARVSRFIPADAFSPGMDFNYEPRPRRPSTVAADIPSPPPAYTASSHRLSLQFSPTSPVYSNRTFSTTSTTLFNDDFGFGVDEEKQALKFQGMSASSRRRASAEPASKKRTRAKWDTISLQPLKEVTIPEETQEQEQESAPRSQESFWHLMREVYPTIPYKPLIVLGIFCSMVSGAITPIFSFMLSRLLFEVSIGARDVSVINTFGGIILAIAVADGLFMGLKYFILETSAMFWVTRLRNICYELVLAQDKKWFDKTENSSVRLVQILIKDGDDARSLIATVLGQCVVVVTMLGVGLIWALVWGWQLTLVGFAIAPVFGVTMAVQTNLVSKYEYRNKRSREEVAKGYYETVLNIRGIRSMGFESVFLKRFDDSVESALRMGVRGAFVEGCTYGVASSLIYLSEALLFYIGAILVTNGTYTYLRMVQTLNLVVFSVSIGSQLMAFTQRIAKSIQATRDFNKLLQLSPDTAESRGRLHPPVNNTISFNNVAFSYPERPDVPVLKNVSLDIRDGESVAIVGASGSGKSTVAALLQRLYEPDAGSITFGPWELGATDVHYLREHVSVVSQNPNLFDATVAENIAYGTVGLPREAIERAAKEANVHEFIMSLPDGYDTMVGENAALISGGQAQRLQIARALVRPSKILILDECTSALDGANQAAVMDTILDAKVGRTTVVVTHKLALMRLCERIVVLSEGAVAEEGTYEQLVERRGVFAALATGGEWQGE